MLRSRSCAAAALRSKAFSGWRPAACRARRKGCPARCCGYPASSVVSAFIDIEVAIAGFRGLRVGPAAVCVFKRPSVKVSCVPLQGSSRMVSKVAGPAGLLRTPFLQIPASESRQADASSQTGEAPGFPSDVAALHFTVTGNIPQGPIRVVGAPECLGSWCPYQAPGVTSGPLAFMHLSCHVRGISKPDDAWQSHTRCQSLNS